MSNHIALEQLKDEYSKSEDEEDMRIAVVLCTLMGAIKSPNSALQELDRICTEYCRQMISELEILKQG
jgi:hypothetical protein